MYEICTKLTIKKLERRHWSRSYVFIGILEQISHILMLLSLLILNR